MFDEPTKGVDVGAKSDIFRLIGKLAQEGKGIVYFSCEIAEILGIADRILVMSYGRIVKELSREEATQELILYYASSGEA
ncbi:Galactose/methyl galactoside import ATP-binding protein MglA [compost metagenome]